MSNIRKQFEVTDIVVTSPTYVTIKRHGYCSHMSDICKYSEVTDIIVTCPTYVNI